MNLNISNRLAITLGEGSVTPILDRLFKDNQVQLLEFAPMLSVATKEAQIVHEDEHSFAVLFKANGYVGRAIDQVAQEYPEASIELNSANSITHSTIIRWMHGERASTVNLDGMDAVRNYFTVVNPGLNALDYGYDPLTFEQLPTPQPAAS